MRRDAAGRIHVAGLPIEGGASSDDSPALDWLFSQGEVAIMHGKVRWTDELREAPPLELTDVNLILRNGTWRHRIRLDATPPAGWGERFSVRARFREPILSAGRGNWKSWSGQIYADLPNGDVSRLNEYADLGALTVGEGEGAVRAWIDVRGGKITGGLADVALKQVRATLGRKLEPLALQSVRGRVGAQQFDNGFEIDVQHLSFVADDGLSWPDTTLYFRQTGAHASNPAAEQGELRASQLDLAVLAQIADRLPLGDAVHEPLRKLAPRGVARNVKANWHGPLSAPRQYQADGLIEQLTMGSSGKVGDTVPGIRNARVQFTLTQAGGNAALAVSDGALTFPGVFEEPSIPMQQLSANVNWQIDGERIAVDVQNMKFANADAAGEARIAWHTADPRKSSSGSRFPGVLDLSGSASRADGTRVHRYLPLGIPEHTRHYVRDGVNAGVATGVQFKVKGNLHDFPFSKPGQGDFLIAAQVRNVNYTYVPASLQAAGELPWPQLTGLSGELVFNRSNMQIRNANGTLGGLDQVKVRNANAEIADLNHPVVGVDANAAGPLADLLELVRKSHITQLTEHALDQAVVTGNAELKLQLSLPLAHIQQSKVQGNVKLVGNDVQFMPDIPQITDARGSVQFSEGGFSIVGVQGRALGGDVKLEGGMGAQPGATAGQKPTVQVRAEGTATADGLRAVAPSGPLAGLAAHATGTTPYAVKVGIRRGVPEVLVNASLQGMAIDLPAPLGKPAQGEMPVRFETRLTPQSADAATPAALQEQLTVDVAHVGAVHYVRQLADAGQTARVLRGAIGVGLPAGQALRLPESGVTAELMLGDVDAGAWHALTGADSTAPSSAAAPADPALQGYAPSRILVRARSLAFGGRTLHQLDANVSRQKDSWQITAKSDELSGRIEYRPESDSVPAPGLIYARLDRLKLTPTQDDGSVANDLLDDEPRTLPALDIVVQNFEMHGRNLGRIEALARNSNTSDGRREWRLAHLNLITPEATFTSSGNWALVSGAGADAERRTVMNFELDVRDSGELLARFNMPGVIKRGRGKMTGQVAWLGAPLSPDYPSMTGQVSVDMQAGQFLKADPGLAKLLSVLSLQSIPRRLTLDFRDVFSEGFAFDFVRGDVNIERGLAVTNNLQMKGLNAAVLMEGKADLEHETQDLRVVVVPEINAMTASLVATAINPVIGLGSFLAQVFLRGPLIQAATQEFRIDGTWSDPRVEKVARRNRAATGLTGQAAEARPKQSGEMQ
uniref:YhdP family protein n=1 Tax=Diaphorobacter aerolatus TaxID=1288495 RepID=UPI001D02B7EA|nr:YhdP family protein [Diaphorobacter aerolatus]